jgi:hypothetical protein
MFERKIYEKLARLYRKAKPNLRGIILEYLVFRLYYRGCSGDENLRRIRYRGLYRRFCNKYVVGRDKGTVS